MLNKYVGIFILSVFIASCAQIILKQSANMKYSSYKDEYLNYKVILGYTLMGISILGAIIAYEGIDLKNGPIIEAVGYGFILLLSWAFLKEKPTRNKVLGIILIIAGITISTS
ncbi:MAG: EamA family transporter [Syntrophomonas sp.]